MTQDLQDRPGAMAGCRIVVPESRELDLFAAMLETQGATTLRCPMVAILDLEDPTAALAWLRRLAAGGFDDLVLLTGEGLRRLLAIARNAAVDAAVIAALGRLRTVVRGPKPVRALREIGLAPGLTAQAPTTEGVIATLKGEALAGRRVGVQLYPGNPNEMLLDFLRGAGAIADPVLPYRYASDAETGRVREIIQAMAAGQVDLIAFTSSPQLGRLADVAREHHLEDALKSGLARTRIAAVGPVVAAAITAMGGTVAIMPDGNFHMKPLVNAIRAALARADEGTGGRR
ncbi:MAG TPA: uroporphyrinogen-III synthase [Stellaceae bacterium]|nr:uroporphyrinogen-III synthase [Stellaceae bacterium]